MRAVDIAETVLAAIASAISLAIAQQRVSAVRITVHPLSAIGDRECWTPAKKAVDMSTIQKFKLREWFAASILVPVFFWAC